MFSENGSVAAVTILAVPANDVVLRRSVDKDGYQAIQLGLPRVNSQKSQEAQKLTPGSLQKKYQARREFFVETAADVKELTVGQFVPGDMVNVIGISKGKGFQGVVKRHGFKGGPASHGHRHVLRSGGSIGSRFPQHVIKGRKMAGRMGADRVTVKNLKIAWVDEEKQLLAIEGAVPGPKGSVVEVIEVVKKKEVNV